MRDCALSANRKQLENQSDSQISNSLLRRDSLREGEAKWDERGCAGGDGNKERRFSEQPAVKAKKARKRPLWRRDRISSRTRYIKKSKQP